MLRSPKLFLFAGVLVVLCCATAVAAVRPLPMVPTGPERPVWTTQDLLTSPTPFAVGHRGYGVNPGTDPTRPVENTLDAFHLAFRDGIRIVELDVQLTADGKVVVFHDDFLPDLSCVNSLTYEELLAFQPETPLFRAVLNSCRHFSRGEHLSGIIMAEIKVPVPLCDGANTSEQAAVSESLLVAAVVAEVRAARMEDQVILNAGSPSILAHAKRQAPEMKRALSLNVLQLLPPEQVSQILGLPVMLIPKNDFGLSWYNIDGIARLPAFPGQISQFIGICAATGSQVTSLDKLVLGNAGPNAPLVVGAFHTYGIKVISWTAETPGEWDFLAQAGSDGITTNLIAYGLEHQAALPLLASLDSGAGDISHGVDALGGIRGEAFTPRLTLYPPRPNPARDGTVRVEFTLPDGGCARIGLVDIAGRVVDSRDIASFGPGRHSLALGTGLAPGVYLVRLSNGQGQVQIKAAVAR